MPPSSRLFVPYTLLFPRSLPRLHQSIPSTIKTASITTTATKPATCTACTTTLKQRLPFLRIQLRLQYASATAGSGAGKPFALGKPGPNSTPSHPPRAKRSPHVPRNYPGPSPSPPPTPPPLPSFLQGKMFERKKKKTYPNMFPEEGTFMYWFLTTKWIHMVITLVCYQSPAPLPSKPHHPHFQSH